MKGKVASTSPGSLWRSAIVQKAAMAVSGLVLFGFVLVHMAGNLKAFQGADKLNAYAEWLREIGSPALPHSSALWIARATLLLAAVVHVVAAVQLTLLNRRARPEAYRTLRPVQLDYASRTMRWSGFLILAYVVYHLMHLTWGNVHPSFVPGDVYANLVIGLRRWPVAIAYMVANLLLGLHLYHGLWSFFQSLGLDHPAYRRARRPFAVGFAVVVTLGFLAVPVGVLAGWLEPATAPVGSAGTHLAAGSEP
jgi:succinate dehydrogenase / fumarate reductase cytochrome b subunit